MTMEKENHLDAEIIIEAGRKEAEKQELYYKISRVICDMIIGKWHGKKINKRIATDAYKAINVNTPGLFDVKYDTRYGMYHLEIKYAYTGALQTKEKSNFKMSMLIAYEGTPVIDAVGTEEHNQCYLLGMQRKEEILSKIMLVPHAVKHYNKAIKILQGIEQVFDSVYPFCSYFKFEASKEVED